jgi:hypothetical protein
MATKKHKTGNRTREGNQTGAKKRARKNATTEGPPTDTAVPRVDPSLGAPKLDAALGRNEVSVKGPQAREAAEALESEHTEGRSAGQSGSLQGLSDVPEAAPESVDELLEEGNAFEAEVIEGVEKAHDADEGEVREVKTHEVSEDDVPDEYLDPEP